MREHAARYGAELVNGVVKSIERVQTGFIVRTDSQAIEARTILLAPGVLNHPPRIPQETPDRGVAYGLIRYCPICDAYEVRGKRLAVLGSSAHGAAEAMFGSSSSASVTLPTPGVTQLCNTAKTNP